jgi:hypothetical protein
VRPFLKIQKRNNKKEGKKERKKERGGRKEDVSIERYKTDTEHGIFQGREDKQDLGVWMEGWQIKPRIRGFKLDVVVNGGVTKIFESRNLC